MKRHFCPSFYFSYACMRWIATRLCLSLSFFILLTAFLVCACTAQEEESLSEGSAAGHSGQESGVIVLPASSCSPALTICEIKLPENGLLTIRFSEHPPRSLQPFTAHALLSNTKVESVRLHISGDEMDMGTSSYPMTEGEPGQYQGNVVLPICATALMNWRAAFILEYGDGKHVVTPFRFTTGSASN